MFLKLLCNRALLAAAICVVFAATLSGCASFSQDGGFDAVKKLTSQSIAQQASWLRTAADQQAAQTRVDAIIADTLTIDAAVQLALINNPQLQSELYHLLLAESNTVQASLIANPSFAMLYARNAGDYTIERSLTLNILSLLFRQRRMAIAESQFAASKQRAALTVLQVAQQTRNAFIKAVTAKQKVSYLTDIQTSAKASYDLAKRMREAGNWSELDRAREQALFLEIKLQQQRAMNACVQAMEQLTRIVGLPTPEAIKLPERLANLPQAGNKRTMLTSKLLTQRIDLQQAKWQSKALAQQLGLTTVTRWANVLELGPATVLEGPRDAESKKGIELSFELPIFDWGQARLKQAKARYQQFLLHAKALAINAASEIRAQQQQYQTAYEIAQRYRDEIIPLNQTLVDESLLRYNGMLMSPFELMATARTQVMAVNDYIDALQDFWLADSNLTMVMVGPVAALGMVGE